MTSTREPTIMTSAKPIFMVILTAAILASCAMPNVNRSTANFNESEFGVDLNICRGGNILEAVIETIGNGALGSLAGAGIVALHGAAVAGSGEALVIGAIVGAVVGLGNVRDHTVPIASSPPSAKAESVPLADYYSGQQPDNLAASQWWIIAPAFSINRSCKTAT